MQTPGTFSTSPTEPLRLVTDALIEQEERARTEQLARVARQLVNDPRLGITQVRIHGLYYDESFRARAECAAGVEAPAAPTGARVLLHALRARCLRRSGQ